MKSFRPVFCADCITKSNFYAIIYLINLEFDGGDSNENNLWN